MKKTILGMAFAVVLACAPSAHAWTIRAAVDSPTSYVHNIGVCTAKLVGAAKDALPSTSPNGEIVGAQINFATAADFVGSFFGLAFSDVKAPEYDATLVVVPCDDTECKNAAAKCERMFEKCVKK